MNLFPILQPKLAAESAKALPLYREAAWDYEKNQPIFCDGRPVVVTGREAVLAWAWKALQTQRYRYEIYTWNYGNECGSLIGQPYTDDLKRAEAVRYVRECLEINPYIQELRDMRVNFLDGLLTIRCRLLTIYGEVNVVV